MYVKVFLKMREKIRSEMSRQQTQSSGNDVMFENAGYDHIWHFLTNKHDISTFHV